MIIKKYLGETMQKAFDSVKRDLGSDAVILHTKTKKRNGILGLWGKEMVEITASKDINIVSMKQEKKEAKKQPNKHLIDLYKKQEQMGKEVQTTAVKAPSLKGGQGHRVIEYELNEIKSLVHNLLQRTQHQEKISTQTFAFYYSDYALRYQ